VDRLSRAAGFLAGAYLFLAALWCGVLVAFAGGAGLVLRSAPSRAAGGAVNRALLDAVDEASYVAVGLLFVLFFLVKRQSPLPKISRALTLRLLIVAAAATIASHLLVTPEMTALRERAGDAFETLAKTDPLRRDWGQLHMLSVLALLLRIGASAGIFGLGLKTLRAQPSVFRASQS
jgi:uncharacterized protein DUF4149